MSERLTAVLWWLLYICILPIHLACALIGGCVFALQAFVSETISTMIFLYRNMGPPCFKEVRDYKRAHPD